MNDIRSSAIMLHGPQMYGDHPYEYHIDQVVEELLRFTNDPEMIAAGYFHDVLEDTAATYENIREIIGERSTRIVWSCSGFGDNRKQRFEMIICKLQDDPEACLVKACDRLVNMRNSKDNPRMLKMYMGEHDRFIETVGKHIPTDLLGELMAFYK